MDSLLRHWNASDCGSLARHTEQNPQTPRSVPTDGHRGEARNDLGLDALQIVSSHALSSLL